MTDGFLAYVDPLAPEMIYPAHHHDVDQLAWVPGGGMRVRVGGAQWRITGEQAVWVPAGAEHEMRDIGGTLMHSLYLAPSRRPVAGGWTAPRVLRLDTLCQELILHLSAREYAPAHVAAVLTVLFALLDEAPATQDALVVPSDSRARVVAEAIIADPADQTRIDEWALRLGVSSKTLLRAFVAETDMTFSQWRTHARVSHAAQVLARGVAVQDAAVEVGYGTSTGFIKAFSGVFNTTPASYVARQRKRDSSRS